MIYTFLTPLCHADCPTAAKADVVYYREGWPWALVATIDALDDDAARFYAQHKFAEGDWLDLPLLIEREDGTEVPSD